jgi:hypothetical protein
MSKRTLKEFRNGSGTRPTHRGYGKPQDVTPDVTIKAEEDLTSLAEKEAEAFAEAERLEQDSAEAAEGNVPGSIAGEAAPQGYGAIDG